MFNPFDLLERIPYAGRYILLVRRERRNLLAGAATVANELDFNEEAIRLVEESGGVVSLRDELRFAAWDRHESDLHALTKGDDPSLWQELSDCYAALRRTKNRGASPPTSEVLRNLASRLRKSG